MKPILVTGAAKKLGAAIALQLASKGHDVLIHYNRSEKDADQVVQKCKSLGVASDTIKGSFSTLPLLTDFIERVTQNFPDTKGLVNNVGNYLAAHLSKTNESEWLSLMQTNFFAPIFLTKALLPSIIKNKGAIVNIGASGIDRSKVQTPAYMLTKASLWHYTRALAKEMAPSQVRVNMVSPGYIEGSLDMPETLPMKRPVTREEVANLISTLFDMPYITGQNIEIAGGIDL